VEGGNQVRRSFRAEFVDQRGRADEVVEQHDNVAQLRGEADGLGERRAAARTETRPGRQRGSALLAGGGLLDPVTVVGAPLARCSARIQTTALLGAL